jgi:hypothetical protein
MFAALYKCSPNTTVKMKAGTNGVANASVKHSFDKKFSVVAAAEVPVSLKTAKFGLTATLG